VSLNIFLLNIIIYEWTIAGLFNVLLQRVNGPLFSYYKGRI